MKTNSPSISHEKSLVQELRDDPAFAAEYFKAALEEEEALPLALRHLAEAYGMAKIAKASGVTRESLYRALSKNGNPRLSTLQAVLKVVGLKLTAIPETPNHVA